MSGTSSELLMTSAIWTPEPHWTVRADGARLRTRLAHTTARKQGTILVLPGLTEFAEKYSEVASEWCAAGYDVVVHEWRGQGGSSRPLKALPQRCHTKSFDVYLADLSAFWNETWLPLVEGQYCAVFAHSFGAHLFTRFLAEGRHHGKGCEAVVLSAPLYDLNTLPYSPRMARLLARLLALLAPTAYAPRQHRYWYPSEGEFAVNRLTPCRERFFFPHQFLDRHPSLAASGATTAWVNACFKSVDKLKRLDLSGLTMPVLGITTTNDQVVSSAAQEEGLAKMPNHTICRTGEHWHEPLMGLPETREPLQERILQFLAAMKPA